MSNRFISRLLNNNTFRNGAIFTIYSVLNKTINFVLLFVIARYVSPEGYGKIDLFNTSVLLLSYFVSLNTTSVISVNYFSYARDQLKESISSVLILTLIGAVVLCVGITLFGNISSIIGLKRVFLYFAVLVSVSNVIYEIILNIWRLEEDIKQYGLYSIGIVFLNFVLSISLIVYFDLGWVGRIYAQLSSFLLIAIISTVALLKRRLVAYRIPSIDTFKDSLNFGLPLIPHCISFWLRQGLDRYLINFFYNSSVLGCYSFALNFSNIIQMIGAAFNATFSVTIYKYLSEGNTNRLQSLKQQSRIIAIAFTALTILVVCICYIFIPIIFPKYSNSLLFIIPLSIGALAQCLYLLYVNYIFYYKKTKILMYITFTTSLVHALLSFLIAKYSLMYLAILNACSNVVIMILVIIYANKLISKNSNGEKIV